MNQEQEQEQTLEQFEELITQRMKRFDLLIDNAKFNHNKWQKEGVEWLLRNELRPNPLHNVRGGIIADEMGLGKTIQAIGLLFANFLKRTLIVVPPVLIEQWAREIYNSTGHRVLMYYRNTDYITVEHLSRAPIVLTTYKTVTLKSSLINKLEWSRIIYDEAHHLRNSNTERHKACRKLLSRVRWLVTGTPVQNSRKDFYNLCGIIGIPATVYQRAENIPMINEHFILRRTKSEVGIELPLLFEETVPINWKNEHEKALAEEIHALIPNQSGVSAAKRKQLAAIFGEGGILTALLRAKQSCILPSLMQKNIEMFEAMNFNQEQYLNALQFTSKLDTVIEYIKERKDNGRGKIIFCHYTHEIDEIEKRLKEIGMQNVKTYDGRNSGINELRKIGEAADALILQIQTGSEGLNLQEHYSEIYFVAPHWNPAVEDQAIARCHRFGQKNHVDVFKFGMNGFTEDDRSFEIYVSERQKQKRDISKEIITKSNQ